MFNTSLFHEKAPSLGPKPEQKAERVFLAPRRAHRKAIEGTKKKNNDTCTYMLEIYLSRKRAATVLPRTPPMILSSYIWSNSRVISWGYWHPLLGGYWWVLVGIALGLGVLGGIGASLTRWMISLLAMSWGSFSNTFSYSNYNR